MNASGASAPLGDELQAILHADSARLPTGNDGFDALLRTRLAI